MILVLSEYKSKVRIECQAELNFGIADDAALNSSLSLRGTLFRIPEVLI